MIHGHSSTVFNNKLLGITYIYILKIGIRKNTILQPINKLRVYS